MKRLVAVLLVLVGTLAMSFAENEYVNWCATAKCTKCGKVVEFTQGARTAQEAEAKAKEWFNAEYRNCRVGNTTSGRHSLVARAAVGMCPAIND